MGGGAGRGRKGGPTGRRHFSTVEEMKSGQVSEPKWKLRRNRDQEGEAEEEEEEDEDEEQAEGSDDDKEQKNKGVSGLIEVHNPNAPVKSAVKVTSVNVDEAGPSQLSRREREELEKQRSKERYLKLQAEGKTEQAQKDLARLEVIRKQREDAAKKREEERLAKEAKKKEAKK